MALTHIHTCYLILDPERSEDFYVGKLGVCVPKHNDARLHVLCRSKRR